VRSGQLIFNLFIGASVHIIGYFAPFLLPWLSLTLLHCAVDAYQSKDMKNRKVLATQAN